MIGNSARPGGSLGEMLHQLREQAEAAASRFLLQVLAAAIGTNRTYDGGDTLQIILATSLNLHLPNQSSAEIFPPPNGMAART